MEYATPGQLIQVLKLFKNTPKEQVTELLKSPYLAMLRDAHISEMNEAEFRQACKIWLGRITDQFQIKRGVFQLVDLLHPQEEAISLEEFVKRSRFWKSAPLYFSFLADSFNQNKPPIRKEYILWELWRHPKYRNSRHLPSFLMYTGKEWDLGQADSERCERTHSDRLIIRAV